MSGCRPYHSYRTQTEIKEVVRQGTRPILADVGVNPHLPALEFIMRVWNRYKFGFYFGQYMYFWTPARGEVVWFSLFVTNFS